MEKSSKIICLGILLFFSTFIFPLIPVLKNFTLVAFLGGPIIVAYGIYSKGPRFREIHKKSYLALILGIALFYLWIILIFLAGSALRIPYMLSVISISLLISVCSFLYGIFSYIRSPEYKVGHNIDANVRSKAFSEIDDEYVFSEVAMKNKNEHLRRDAVRQINDPEILAELLFNAEYEDVRKDVVKKITDENVLMEYVQQGKSDCAEFFARSLLDRVGTLTKRNFNSLNYLIMTVDNEIALNSDITLDPDEEAYFKDGIEINVDDLTIDGNGFCIDAGGRLPFFTIMGNNITFKNLRFRNGSSKNIHNKGGVTFINCVFERNSGCIIYNEGVSKLDSCAFGINNAQVIRNFKRLELDNCSFKDNMGINYQESETNHIIQNRGVIYKCVDCVFKDNAGGAIYNSQTFSALRCTFEGNNQKQFGGAINNSGTQNYKAKCTLSECRFIRNASELGGAISGTFAEISIDNSVFNENSASVGGAVLFNSRFSTCRFEDSKLANNTSESGVIYNFGGLGKTAYDGMMNNKAIDAAFLRYHNLEFADNSASSIINDDGKIEQY